MANKTLLDLRTAILANANIIAGQVDTPYLDARIAEGMQALHDAIVAVNPTYFLKSTTNATIAGGLGGNLLTLPSDFDKLYGVNHWNGDVPMTVPALPSYRERNDPHRRCYELGPTAVQILPASRAAGTFNFDYIPLAPTLKVLGFAVTGADNVVASTKTFTFANAQFDQDFVGWTLVVAGASNAGNNGNHTITAVPSPMTLVVSTLTLVNETFTSAVTASVTPTSDAFIGQLPAVYQKFSAYVELHGAIPLVDRRGMDVESAALTNRLGVEARRVTSMAVNRRAEPQQMPMVRRRYWWDTGGA